jgi:tripartite-type tricarboxylate transporter receptor subunit TctC
MRETQMNIRLLSKVLGLSVLVLAAGSAGLAQAQDYPDKEVTVIVNYGAGGGTDLSTRALADATEPFLGQPLQVVNRAGGSGTVGPTFVANAAPDGYTIGVASFSPMAITPHVQPVPYKVSDFRFLLGFARYLTGIAVPKDSPFRTIQDAVDAAKAGKDVKYGAASSIESVAMVRLGDATDTKFKWIRYGSGQEVSTAALSGEVDLIVADPKDIAPFVKSGEMRALASASSVRLPGLPDVETLQEQGIDVAVESYAGLAAPAGISDEVAGVLEEAFAKGYKDPKFQATLEKLGMQPAYYTGEEYGRLIAEGYEAMGKDLAALGLAKQ